MGPQRLFRPTRFGHGECNPTARDPDASLDDQDTCLSLSPCCFDTALLADVAAMGNQFLSVTSACNTPSCAVLHGPTGLDGLVLDVTFLNVKALRRDESYRGAYGKPCQEADVDDR